MTAMKDEFDALVKNDTWSLIPRSPEDNIINTKWFFKVKQREDGSIKHYKACLVANGMKLTEGMDHSLTFSPVVKENSIGLVLMIVISKNWEMKQINISNAFMHGKIEERIVVTQLKGFEDSVCPQHECLLHSSLYGFKQFPLMWYKSLKEFLVKIGFKECYCNPSLFILVASTDLIYLFTYVDDIILIGSSKQLILKILKCLREEFSI